MSYLSTCVDEFPNFFFCSDPNPSDMSNHFGSPLELMEKQIDLAIGLVKKMKDFGMRRVGVKREAVLRVGQTMEKTSPVDEVRLVSSPYK